ncbi:MAG: hypothetical protein AB1426_00270 [Bacillota bacterium]
MKKTTNHRMSFYFILLLIIVFLLQAPTAFAAYSNDQLIPAVNPTNVANSLSWTFAPVTTDYKLLVSNSPEDPTGTGLLYKDSEINGTGKFRVYWYHKNATGSSKYIGFGVWNNTGKTVKVNLGKRAYAIQQSGESGASMGQRLLFSWLSSSDSEYTYATLNNGSYTYIGFSIPNGLRGTGMYNVIIRDASTGAIVTNGITVKTYISSTSNPGSLSNILPKDPSPTTHIRGRFDHAPKYLTWNASTNQQFSFTSTLNNNWPVPTNDLNTGYSAVDGQYVYGYGSYGQDLNITVNTPSGNWALVLEPSLAVDGNGGGSVTHYLATYVSTRGSTVSRTIPANNGWVITTGTGAQAVTIRTSLPGGEMAPLHLVCLLNN